MTKPSTDYTTKTSILLILTRQQCYVCSFAEVMLVSISNQGSDNSSVDKLHRSDMDFKVCSTTCKK